MKKHILYIFLISLTFTSCDDSEDSSVAIKSYSPITIDISISENNVIVNESAIIGEAVAFEVTATLPEVQALDYVINFEQNGGTSDSDDFTTNNIIIRAGELSGKSDIEILKTGDIEGDEDLSIKAVTFEETAKLSGEIEFKATITDDYITDVLDLSTDWTGGEFSFTSNSIAVTLDFCEIDIDVRLFTSAGAFVGYLGATGACTEVGSLSGLPDGDYFIVLDLYDNPHVTFGATATVPVTVTYNQDYIGTSGSFTYTGINLSSPSDLYAAATVSVSGYNYTVTAL